MFKLFTGYPFNPSQNKAASYSYFVLPFAYRPSEYNGSATCAHNLIYKKADNLLDEKWRRRYLTMETTDILFNRTKYFELKDECGNKKTFTFKANFLGEEEIEVTIDSPIIVLFEFPNLENIKSNKNDTLLTGMLILPAFFPDNIKNGCRPNLDDLLEFNERFRYIQPPFDGHWKDFKRLFKNCPVDFRCENNQKIGQWENDEEMDKAYLSRWEGLLQIPFEYEGKRYSLITTEMKENAEKYIKNEVAKGQIQKDSGWIIYADNRAFTWTCAITQDGGNALRKQFNRASQIKNGYKFSGRPYAKHNFLKKPQTPPEEFGHWIKLMFMDPPDWKEIKNDKNETIKCQNIQGTNNSRQFERDWAKERTYYRWEEWGTFYGFCYHGGAMLAGAPEGLPLWKHFGTIYFDMTLLLFYLRVALFRFSIRINQLSSRMRDCRECDIKLYEDEWINDFKRLRHDFAVFTNLYQFPLLSNQTQGVEMYEIARKQMDVDELFKEVQSEIQSSHEFLEMQLSDKMMNQSFEQTKEAKNLTKESVEHTKAAKQLTVVATAGLVFALTASILGMSVLIDNIRKFMNRRSFPDYELSNDLILSAITFLFVAGLVLILILCSKKLARLFAYISDGCQNVDDKGENR